MVAAAQPAQVAPSRSLWRESWRRLRRNRLAVVCGAIFLMICLFSFAGPFLMKWLANVDGSKQDVLLGASAPSAQHWMGTDILGRDLLVRTMDGGQIAIKIALLATIVALVIGVTYGAIAGWAGGKVDEVMMRFVDVLYALPSTVFVIVIMALVTSRSQAVLFILIGAIS